MANHKPTKSIHRKASIAYKAPDMYHWHRRIAKSMMNYRQWKWNTLDKKWERGEPNQWLKGIGVDVKDKV